MATDEHVATFGALDTSTVSDALDRLGLPGAAPGLLPLAVDFKLCGRAVTLRYGPTGTHGGTVGDYIDDIAPGSILVLDNAGRLDCTVWGDILTFTAHQRSVGGTVIHGVCRDVSRALELGYPIFSRGRSMRTGKDRVRLEEMEVPVSLGDVQVLPGDVILGDADGIVVVPAAAEADVLAAAAAISDAEERIRLRVREGTRLDEARREAGYHALQTRVTPPDQEQR